MTGIKYTDLKIVRDKTGAVVTVKSATVDKTDNTKVAIETYEALTDGEAYTVTYTAADEAKTESSATFTATAGVVADIALNTYSIPANTPTEIKYQLLDANGVLIEEKGIGKAKSDKVDISIENFNGYQNDNKVTLYKTGDKATVKVVYHTWKYNNTDGTEEGKVEKPFEIVAVDPSSVIETYDFSIVKGINGIVDFKRDTLVTQIALGDDADVDRYAKFSFRKADGTDIHKNLDYTVSSGNENVLLANGTVAEGAKLTPVAAGATYLVIKNASGAVVKTLPITVVAKRSLSTMSLDKTNLTVASTMSDLSGKQSLTISVMDQYSDPYDNFVLDTIELKSSTNPGAGLNCYQDSRINNKVTIAADTNGANPAVKEGTYVFTADLKDTKNDNNTKKVTFSITVSKNLVAASNRSCALVMMNSTQKGVVSKVDTTITADPYSATKLVPTIVEKNNGSIVGIASTAAVSDKVHVTSVGAVTLKKNGVEIKNDAGIYNGAATSKSYAGFNNHDLFVNVTTGTGSQTNPFIKKLEPGTYTLSLVALLGDGTLQNMSTSFVVEDSQKVFEAKVEKESVTDKTTLNDIFESTDYVTFYYAGAKLESDYKYADADYTKYNNGSINVKKVFIDMKVPGTGNKYARLAATVGRTFTFSNTLTLSKDAVAAEIKTFQATYGSGSAINANVTVASYAALIASANTIATNYNDLTLAERTALKSGYDDVMAVKAKAQPYVNVVAEINAFKTAYVLNGAMNPGLDITSKQTLVASATSISAAVAALTSAEQAALSTDTTLINAVKTAAETNIADTNAMNEDISTVEAALLVADGHTLDASNVTNIAFASMSNGTSIADVTPTAIDGNISTNEAIIDASTDETQIVIKKKSDISTGDNGNYQLVEVAYSNGTADPVTKIYKIALADSKSKVVITIAP